jgi:hypothetical protein
MLSPSLRLSRLKVVLAIVVAAIGIGLAACGGGSESQPGASPSHSSGGTGWA